MLNLIWVLFIGIVLLHELAHYLDAKRQGIFIRFFFTGVTVGVKCATYFKYRWNYLGGIIYSFLLYPVCLFCISVNLLDVSWLWGFPIVCVLLGFIDVLVFISFRQSWKNMKFAIVPRRNLKVMRILSVFLGGMPDNIIWVN